MAIKFGGRTAEEVVTAQQQKEFDQQKSRGQVKDPVTSPSGTVSERVSQLGDMTLWVEQLLSEMSALALKRKRLEIQLKDPNRRDSPGYMAARQRYDQWGSDLIQYENDITRLEATCDRLWQSLPEAERKYGLDWGTAPETERLIGQSWLYKAKQFEWPVAYTFETTVLRRTEPYVRRELEQVIGKEPVLLGEEPPI